MRTFSTSYSDLCCHASPRFTGVRLGPVRDPLGVKDTDCFILLNFLLLATWAGVVGFFPTVTKSANNETDKRQYQNILACCKQY